MLKKTITYTDFDGNERTEDHYFHISKTELAEMNFGEGGKMDEKLSIMVNALDAKEMFKTFKEILELAYGKKSLDGRRFEKSPEIFKEFTETEAYNVLIMELFENQTNIEKFINSIIPWIPEPQNQPAMHVPQNN